MKWFNQQDSIGLMIFSKWFDCTLVIHYRKCAKSLHLPFKNAETVAIHTENRQLKLIDFVKWRFSTHSIHISWWLISNNAFCTLLKLKNLTIGYFINECYTTSSFDNIKWFDSGKFGLLFKNKSIFDGPKIFFDLKMRHF